jgi:hypothetical protein
MYIAIEDYWARLKGKNPSDKFQKKKKEFGIAETFKHSHSTH